MRLDVEVTGWPMAKVWYPFMTGALCDLWSAWGQGPGYPPSPQQWPSTSHIWPISYCSRRDSGH